MVDKRVKGRSHLNGWFFLKYSVIFHKKYTTKAKNNLNKISRLSTPLQTVRFYPGDAHPCLGSDGQSTKLITAERQKGLVI